jgi:hypothetical protein
MDVCVLIIHCGQMRQSKLNTRRVNRCDRWENEQRVLRKVNRRFATRSLVTVVVTVKRMIAIDVLIDLDHLQVRVHSTRDRRTTTSRNRVVATIVVVRARRAVDWSLA